MRAAPHRGFIDGEGPESPNGEQLATWLGIRGNYWRNQIFKSWGFQNHLTFCISLVRPGGRQAPTGPVLVQSACHFEPAANW